MTKKELEQKTDSFVSTYLGQSKGYPDDSQYWGQCLSIVKLYIKEVFGISPPPSGTNSAYGYWSNFPSPLDTVFERVLNTIDVIPEYGWIAVWKPWSGNTYGHIAIVDRGCTQTVLKNLAQNWSSKNFQEESQSYTNVIGFLKPILTPEVTFPTITEDEQRALVILKQFKDRTEGIKDGNYEGASRACVEAYKDLISLQIVHEGLKKIANEEAQEILDLKGEKQILADKLAEEQKQVQTWQSQYMTANESLESMQEQLELTTNERNDYKKWFEKVKEDLKNLDKMTGIQHILYGIKLLVKKQK